MDVKAQLAWKLEMKDPREVQHFFGMRIMRCPDGGISID